MKKLISAIILVGAVIVLAVTCPDRNAHEDALRSVIAKASTKKIDQLAGSNALVSSVASLVGSVLVDKVADKLLDTQLEVNNYVLFSVGKVTLGDETKPISFGILNNVYTISEDDALKALDK